MAHNKPTGSKGNCTPEYAEETLGQGLTVSGDTPSVLDTRGKAPDGATSDEALSEFSKAKAGGRYGSAKSSAAPIPLSSQGPETRDGA